MVGRTTCLNCPDGQYQDGKKKFDCFLATACPIGTVPNKLKTGCVKPLYMTAYFCKRGLEYLNDTSHDRMDHTCNLCPDGANCERLENDEQPKYSTLKAKDGYLSMSWNKLAFGKCPVFEACVNDTCSIGHDPNSSELCSQCLPTYASEGRGELCNECPETIETVLLITMSCFVILAVFVYLVYDNLDGASLMLSNKKSRDNEGNRNGDGMDSHKRMPFHSIIIRIVSSYLQVCFSFFFLSFHVMVTCGAVCVLFKTVVLLDYLFFFFLRETKRSLVCFCSLMCHSPPVSRRCCTLNKVLGR